MLLAPRYQGTELPIFPDSTEVVLYPGGYTPKPGQESFVRAVRMNTPISMLGHLGRILKRTDQELETVAEYCEAPVVEHTWGLAKINSENARPGRRSEFIVRAHSRLRIPRGYLLAAEVAVVPGAKRLETEDSQNYPSITAGLDKYYERKGIKLSDLRLGQFVINASNGQPVMVDVEPFLSRRSSPNLQPYTNHTKYEHEASHQLAGGSWPGSSLSLSGQ